MPGTVERNLALAPLACVSRVGGVGDLSIWKSASGHPQLYLAGEIAYDEAGATLFEVDILPIAGCDGAAALCFDFGAGFDARDRAALRPTALSARSHSAAVRFSARPKRIRLDPCASAGEFLCSEVRVSAVSRVYLQASGEEPVRLPQSAGSAIARIDATVLREQEKMPRIGAILHLYYEDLWPEMSEYLHRIAFLERLFVSIRDGAPRDLEGRIAASFPGALVRRVPNQGRDVLPFLRWLELAAQEGLELVCKIHAKRSPHVPQGDAWRRDMLDKLLGSEAIVSEIVSSLRAHPALGIVGPAGHVVSSTFFWERNAARVEALCLRMGIDIRGVAFDYVAGSMFWARVDALSPLMVIGLRDEDFEPEAGQVDGTLAHAIERCFAVAALAGEYRLEETQVPAGTVSGKVSDFAPSRTS